MIDNNTSSNGEGKKFRNKNRAEFRFPDQETWIYEAMAKHFCKLGYIKRPTVSEVAKLSLLLVAMDFMKEDEERSLKLKGITPIRYYEKLTKELEDTKTQLARYEMIIERSNKLSEDQEQVIKKLIGCLKWEEDESRELRMVTMAIGKRIQQIANLRTSQDGKERPNP